MNFNNFGKYNNQELTVGKIKELLEGVPDDWEFAFSPYLYPEYGGEAWICVTDNNKKEYYIYEDVWV